MVQRTQNWFVHLCIEPFRDSHRVSRLAKLRVQDRKAYLAFIGEAGRAILCHLSPFAGDALSINAADGRVDLTWDQPPVIVPRMAWDRIVTAFAASAAKATRTKTGVSKNTHWSPSMFERHVPPPRVEDGFDIAPEDAACALRLAKSIVGVYDVVGRTPLSPWRKTEMPDRTHVIDRIYGDTAMSTKTRDVLAACYAYAVHVCDVLHRPELERFAALAYARSLQGLPTTDEELRQVIGDRPRSHCPNAASP